MLNKNKPKQSFDFTVYTCVNDGSKVPCTADSMADAKQRNAQIKKRKQLLYAFISVLVENTDRISNFFVGDLMVLLDLVTRIGVKK
jgi:hypothetical protein